jgi:hypothetical protein
MSKLLKAGVVVSIVLSIGATAPAAPPNCPVSLYWASPRVKTAKLPTCLRFAQDTMKFFNLQNIRVSRDEVAGTTANSYAAITCVPTTGNATAMVMVAGSNGNEAQDLRNKLRDHVAGIICFEGC